MELLKNIKESISEFIIFEELDLHVGINVVKFFKDKFYSTGKDNYILLSHSIEDKIIEQLVQGNSDEIECLSDTKNVYSSRYNVNFIDCKTVFHPKLYIQIESKSCIKFIIGSANLTGNAQNKNLESALSLIIKPNSDIELRYVANQILQSLDRLFIAGNIKYKIPKLDWINFSLDNYLPKNISYIENLNCSLFNQIMDFIKESTIIKATAYAPFYNSEGESLLSYLSRIQVVSNYEEFDSMQQSNYHFHIKAYIFKTTNSTILFIGSPNNSAKSFLCKGLNIYENGLLIRIRNKA